MDFTQGIREESGMEIEREQMLDLQHQAESRNRLYYHPWKEREVRRCSQKFYQERCMENLMLKDVVRPGILFEDMPHGLRVLV